MGKGLLRGMVESIQRASTTSRDNLLAALIVAFKYSALKSVAGNNSFASVLDEQWESIMAPGSDVMKLQVVYDLLRQQPGFDANAAVPPLARIKTWEPYLRVRVDLPKELIARGVNGNPELHARPCSVPQAELLKAVPAAAGALAMNSNPRLTPVKQAKEEPKTDHKKAPWAILATVVVLVGLAGGGYAFTQLREVPVDVNTVSDSIPLESAVRQGSTLTLKLRDKAWLSFPRGSRLLQVTETFNKNSGLSGVNELRIVDDQGNLVATAKSGRPQPSVELLQ